LYFALSGLLIGDKDKVRKLSHKNINSRHFESSMGSHPSLLYFALSRLLIGDKDKVRKLSHKI